MINMFETMISQMDREELIELATRLRNIQKENELQLEILSGKIVKLTELANKNGQWHDLKKDPSDTPKKGGRYLIYYEDNEPNAFDVLEHRELYRLSDWEPKIGHFHATAWCELKFVREVE